MTHFLRFTVPCAYFASSLFKQHPAKQLLHSKILFQVSAFIFNIKLILCKEITANQQDHVVLVTKAKYLKQNTHVFKYENISTPLDSAHFNNPSSKN